MKLLDLLKQELKEWPEGATCIVQDYDGEVKAGFGGTPTFSTKYGMWLGCIKYEGLFETGDLCEKNTNTVITKEQWDSLNITKHKHAEMIALCAEFAQTMETPMSMFQYKGVCDKEWQNFEKSDSVSFNSYREYRLKPKTKLINGVEIPDISFTPKQDKDYYFPAVHNASLFGETYWSETSIHDKHRLDNCLCYPYTEEGKQAAIAHSKVLLGIKGETK